MLPIKASFSPLTFINHILDDLCIKKNEEHQSFAFSDEVSQKHNGKMSLMNFLDIMIQLQAGNDPFEEVQQVRLSQFIL